MNYNIILKKPKHRLAFGLLVIASIIISLILFWPRGSKTNLEGQKSHLDTEKTRQLASKIIARCQARPDWRGCFGNELANYNDQSSFPETLKVLSSIQDQEPKTRDCHLIAHKLSASEVAKNPSRWVDIFNLVDQTTCTNGFVHGALEGRSRFDSTFELSAQIIPQICTEIEAKTSQRTGTKSSLDDACAHILGHILLAQVNADIDTATAVCNQLENEYKNPCLQGIFMENILRENLVVHEVAKPLPKTRQTADTINLLCINQQNEAQAACFRELSHLYTIITKNDPQEVFAMCHQAQTEAQGKECYFHAINLMIANDGFDRKNTKLLCLNYFNKPEILKECILRSVSPLLLSSVKFTPEAINFCLTLPNDSQEFCYARIGDRLKSLASLPQRTKLCAQAPAKYQKFCQGI